MIITYDTEFLDDGKTVELFTIGMVAANGDELYRVIEDAPWRRMLPVRWLVDNVGRHLPMTFVRDRNEDATRWDWDPHHPEFDAIQPREDVAMAVESFLWRHAASEDELAKLWAYYSATDHVALYQLWGPMIECTRHGMDMRTSCLKQEEEAWQRAMARQNGDDTEFAQGWWENHILPKKPVQDPATEHHALHDARHDMALARWLGVDS